MTLDIPNYRILEKLGVGAQTRIFRARCMRSGKDYAVKIVKLQNPEDTGIVDLMRAEHAIGSSIDHPHLRKVYELRLIRQRLRVRGAILFMEYIDGVPITVSEYGQSLDELLGLFGQVAAGLEAMHLAGYVHADLKPGNMLVTPEGKVSLIDFGQSAQIHEAKQRIQGTPDYMAPEQVQRKKLDQRTDVFGLGATLHRLLTGQPVATEINQTVNLASPILVRRDNGYASQKLIDQLPTCVARLLADCCADDPAARPRDMAHLIKRIDLVRTILARPVISDEDIDESDLDELDNDGDAGLAAAPIEVSDNVATFGSWEDMTDLSESDEKDAPG